MSQTLFWFLTAILGGVYSLFLLGGGRLRHLWVAAAFPVGVFLTSIVYGFHILFRIPLTAVGVGTCLAAVLTYGIFNIFKQKGNFRDLIWLFLFLPVFF